MNVERSRSKLCSVLSLRSKSGGREESTSRTACVTKVGGGEPLVGGQTMNRRRVGGWLTLAGAEGSKARTSGGGMDVGEEGGGGREAEGPSALGLAPRVVRHVERDSGRFVVWHVEARFPVSPNYKTNAAHSVIIQLADVPTVVPPPPVHRALPPISSPVFAAFPIRSFVQKLLY